jgi:hypothetical protein
LSYSTVASNTATGGSGGAGGNGSSGNGGNGGSAGSALGGGLFNGGNTPMTVVNVTFGGTSANPATPDVNRNTVAGGAGGKGGNGGISGSVTGANGGAGGTGGNAQGGAVWVTDQTASFVNDTIVFNRAVLGAGGAGGAGAGTGSAGAAGAAGLSQGGGYFGNGATNDLGNTIIALDSAASAGPDVFGIFASQGNNVIGMTTGGSGFVATDQTGVNANALNIGPLQNNGGLVPTDALQTGSVAIDKGNNGLVPNGVMFDARGPGFMRIVNGKVDVGAFEVQ